MTSLSSIRAPDYRLEMPLSEATNVPERHFKKFESLADSAVPSSGAAPPRRDTGTPHTGHEPGRMPVVIVGSLLGRRGLDTMIPDLRWRDSVRQVDQSPMDQRPLGGPDSGD